MDNSIEQYAIGELLDGRYFYIPSYQRGYRWTDKQVDDLLRDLLCFANDTKDDYDFYCLQPIIARPITDEKKLKVAKTEHSHPLGMVVSTHFRCGKGVKRGLKNGALPFTID